ncbi:alpha/beta hydrolase [Lysobacter korlensis]|uniref:Alpha/beta hydrolase n=1 Tax=Lysobacter korlensis TaxID=553636 RepID=A0ABV6RX68_9GAMM
MSVPDMIRHLETHGEQPDPRTDIDTASLISAYPELGAVNVTDLTIATPHGEQPARLYRLPDATPIAGLVWAHGGAFVGGHLDMPESHWVALSLAARGVSVLAVDYSKALNGVRFPVPSDDVLAAWEWAVANIDRLGVTVGRLHLGGASAGGNLTAGVIARLRDAGGVLPASLVIVYPALHSTMPEPSEELHGKLEEHGGMPLEVMRQLNLNFTGSEEGLTDPVAFPGHGEASGFPPVYILNADTDPLRASGEAFGRQLRDAGGRVLVEVEPEAAHGHLDQPHSAEGRSSVERIFDWLTGVKAPTSG